MKKGFWFALGYTLLLMAFTVYILMDTFVIGRVYSQVPVEPPTSPTVPQDQVVITENSYSDSNITITLTE